MISGDRSLAEGKRGAFYNTLEEFHKYWDRVDIICPPIFNFQFKIFNFFKPITHNLKPKTYFGNVFVHPSPWPLAFQPFWILKKGKQIYKDHKFNLMTVHEYPPFYNGIGARWLWSKIKVPYVVEIMHVPGYPKAADLKEKIYKQAVKLFIKSDVKKAAKVRVINQKQIPELLTRAGVPAEKMIYLPAFYIDSEIFKPINVRKEYDIVFAARLEKNKGILELIQAIKLAKIKFPAIKLLIIGSGSLKNKLSRFVNENRLNGNVIFSGWLETAQDVARDYNSAKIFINPSLNEGGPRVILEAMACGLPVITTRVGLALDIIKDGENGLFTGWKPAEMAERIMCLLSDGELQKKFSQAGPGVASGFSKDIAIKNYAHQLQSQIPEANIKKNLLIITQKIDDQDQLLGFFIDWVAEFSKYFKKVTVLCLEKRTFELPGNVQVISLGKDHGRSKIQQLFSFYRYTWSLRTDYDVVFVHMNPIWTALGGFWWHMLSKKVFFWYTHKAVTFKLKLAEKFADAIFTGSKESFRLPSRKVIVAGHGIDTELFKPDPSRQSRDGIARILSVGRIAPVKNYETLVDAAKILNDRKFSFYVDIIGEPALKKDQLYQERLKKRIKDLGLEERFKFWGKIVNKNLVSYYQSHDIFAHLSKTGSVDKTLFEAMACGMRVISCNDSARAFLSSDLIFNENDPEELAEKISSSANKNNYELRDYVVKNHNLKRLIKFLSNTMNYGSSPVVGAEKVFIYPFPFSNKNNKYIGLLYGNLNGKEKDGFMFEIKNGGFPSILNLKSLWKNRGNKNIIHIHWPTELYGSRFIIKSALLMAVKFPVLFFLKKIYGFKIVWTMHNYQAHDYPHPAIDSLGCDFLFFLSDCVIVQQKSACEVLKQKYPGKNIRFVPHGNYIGAYGPRISMPADARESRGLGSDDIVLLSLGMIRPYKKIDEIIKSFNKCHKLSRAIKLFIIGGCNDKYLRYLVKLAGDNKDIVIKPQFIADAEIPDFFSIADYSVFWYDDTVLTSGALILSLSYGVPVVARDIPASELIKNGQNGFLFRDGKELCGIFEKLTILTKPSPEDVTNSVKNLDWKSISDELANILINL